MEISQQGGDLGHVWEKERSHCTGVQGYNGEGVKHSKLQAT